MQAMTHEWRLMPKATKELLWIRKIWYRHDKPVDPLATLKVIKQTTLREELFCSATQLPSNLGRQRVAQLLKIKIHP